MQRLPPELVELVLDYCDIDVLARVRLTSQALAAAAEPSLFANVSVCCFAFSYSRLRLLAESSLARHVKSLIVYTTDLVVLRDEEQLAAHLTYDYNDSQTGDTIVSGCHVPSELIPLAWQTYKHLMSTCGEPSTALSLGVSLCKLPNLSRVTFASLVDDNIPDEWSAIADEYWSKPSIRLVRELNFYADISYGEPLQDTVPMVLGAVAMRHEIQTLPVRELEIEASLALPLFPATAWHEEEIDSCGPAILSSMASIERLRVFNLSGYGLDSDTPHSDLSSMLRACTSVRCLSITYKSDEPRLFQSHRPLAALSTLLSEAATIWPHLEVLHLSMEICNADMMELLQSCKTLKHLSLESCRFDDVVSVLNFMAQINQLHSVELSDLTEWGGSNEDEAYFCDERPMAGACDWIIKGGEGRLPGI